MNKKNITKTVNLRRRRFLRQLGFMFLANFILPRKTYAAAKVIASRLGDQGGDNARFVLELDEKVDYNLSYLSNSSSNLKSILVNIKDVSGIENIVKNSKSVKFIKGYRVIEGETGPKIAIDLTKPALVAKDYWLAPASGYANRLVLDISAVSDVEFMSKATKEEINNKVDDITELSNRPDAGNQKSSIPETKIVVLDPGHGGKDPGAIGTSGICEKNVVLLASIELKRQLEQTGRYKVLLTRNTDKFLSLNERIMRGRQINLIDDEYAKSKHADIFMSVHADSLPKNSVNRSKTRGLSVYTLSDKASDIEAEKLAERENAADLIEFSNFENYDKNTQMWLASLAQDWTDKESKKIAKSIVNQIDNTKGIELVSKLNSSKTAPFAVLKTSVPAVLVEMGYLSNYIEEKLLQQNWYRAKLASSIVKALDNYPKIKTY
jgi:N-acetylmuramoyl-L-alanine amidase